MLAKNKVLRHLDLGLNSLGYEESRALAAILAKTRSNALETLCLADNSISDKGAVELASALADSFRDKGELSAIAIGAAPERPRLAALDLSGNRITEIGVYNLTTGLLKCANELVTAHKMSATKRQWKPLLLDALVLAENPIGPKGAMMLSAALRTRWEADDERMARVTEERERERVEKTKQKLAQMDAEEAAAANGGGKRAASGLAEEGEGEEEGEWEGKRGGGEEDREKEDVKEEQKEQEEQEESVSIAAPLPPGKREVRALLAIGALDLTACGIGAAGAKEIAIAAPGLRHLFISGNRVGCEVSIRFRAQWCDEVTTESRDVL